MLGATGTNDPLESPEIRRRTARMLALKRKLVPAEVRSFVGKPVFTEPTAAPLFRQWNKEVPNVMGPK